MLEIEIRIAGTIAILDLTGNIDIDAANFIEKIGWCLENNYREIICNFESVEIVDYAGLSVLAIAYKDVINHKGRMKFLSVAAHIKKVFNLVCLDRVFDIYDDEKHAIKSFEEDTAISAIQKKQLRRRFKRLPLDINIEFKSKAKTPGLKGEAGAPPSAAEEKFYRGKVLNLSAVGLLVFADKVYPLGEILRIRLLLSPKPGVVELDAKVVWLVQKELQPQIYPGMGLEFYQIDNKAQKNIVDFVERNLPLDSASQR